MTAQITIGDYFEYRRPPGVRLICRVKSIEETHIATLKDVVLEVLTENGKQAHDHGLIREVITGSGQKFFDPHRRWRKLTPIEALVVLSSDGDGQTD